MYCKKCGGKLESYASNCAFCGEPVEKYDAKPKYIKQEKVEKAPHMSTGKWIGLSLLNLIPVLGQIIYIIIMLKLAFGATKDLTLKSFAKAVLLKLVLAAILVTVALILFWPEITSVVKKVVEALK